MNGSIVKEGRSQEHIDFETLNNINPDKEAYVAYIRKEVKGTMKAIILAGGGDIAEVSEFIIRLLDASQPLFDLVALNMVLRMKARLMEVDEKLDALKEGIGKTKQ